MVCARNISGSEVPISAIHIAVLSGCLCGGCEKEEKKIRRSVIKSSGVLLEIAQCCFGGSVAPRLRLWQAETMLRLLSTVPNLSRDCYDRESLMYGDSTSRELRDCYKKCNACFHCGLFAKLDLPSPPLDACHSVVKSLSKSRWSGPIITQAADTIVKKDPLN